MSTWFKSKFESKFKDIFSEGGDFVPDGETTLTPKAGSLRIAKPGLLSTTCSPGKSKIVVCSILSLLFPFRYENLADSINALWIVLKGLAREFPWFSILSVASRSFGLT